MIPTSNPATRPFSPILAPAPGSVTAERLTAGGRGLAAGHRVATGTPSAVSLHTRLAAAARFLAAAHAAVRDPAARPPQAGVDSAMPGAEWLLDNYYIVAEQIAEVRVDLPRRYYRELPKLASGPLHGYPRVYALARALIAQTDSLLDLERISAFVAAYQSAVPADCPLTLGELWSVPIMLRLSLVETLAHTVSAAARQRAGVLRADHWADRLLTAAEGTAGPLAAPVALTDEAGGDNPAFLSRFGQRLRDGGATLDPLRAWLDRRLTAAGSNAEEVVRLDHRRQAAVIATVSNAITSMRRVAAIDWPTFVESLSATEAILRADPTAVYPAMDFATRDRYRHHIEKLARWARQPEPLVAAAAVRLAHAAADDPRAGHVGYYLIDAGRPALEAALGVQPPLRDRLGRGVHAHPTGVYLGLLGSVTAGGIAAALTLAGRNGGRGAALLGTATLAALPAANLATSLINHLLTTALLPHVLPKLDFKEGIPADARTFVVIPILLGDEAQLRETLEQLEVRYLANPDSRLHYALLSDFPDAPAADLPGEANLLRQAESGIAALNTRYGRADGFYLFHRRRRFNPAEGAHAGVWMGWERKRGKLLTFNRLLRGTGGADFTTCIGDSAVWPTVRYVITLDADTQLPPGAAARLVGALHHPLNRAELDAARRVVRGYGLLQPRIAGTVTGGAASPFAQISSGHTGVDPYTTAVSDVYQDLFHSGIYIGKGIYDVDAFMAAVDGRFPDNTLLSHDLLEGAYARAGLVSDIALYEDHPSRYSVYTLRQDRWIRGDWQIARWLLPRVPDARGRRVRNPLPLWARWQIFDNLRRSLDAPASLAFLLAGWGVLPGPAAAWTAGATLVRAFPLLAHLINGLPHKPAGTPWRRHLRFLRHETWLNALYVALNTALLPDQAAVHGQAIGRAWTRMVITQRQLLAWQTAAAAHRSAGNALPDYVRRMAGDSWGLGVGLGLAAALTRRVPSAAPFLLAWTAAPAVAYWISQRRRATTRPLRADEQADLRRWARGTWRYFEQTVGSADGWLAPDNYQETPTAVLARRTSPTNLSLSLLATLSARHFGYLSLSAWATRLDAQLAGMERLERLHGHFYNWYDTASGAPLTPRYVSTVDSGNLAGHLVVLRQGCLARLDAPLFGPETLDGLTDTALALTAALAAATQAGALDAAPALVEASAAFHAALTPPPLDLPAWVARIATLAQRVDAVTAALAAHAPDPALGDVREWAAALATEVAGYAADCAALLPWVGLLADPPPGLSGLAERLLGEAFASDPVWVGPLSPDAPPPVWPNPSPAGNLIWCAHRLPAIRRMRHAVRGQGFDAATAQAALVWFDRLQDSLTAAWTASEGLVSRIRDLAMRSHVLSADTDFGFLYDSQRKLFAIGYNVTEGRRDASYYDLLASEARLGSYVAVARGAVAPDHWFQLGRALTAAGDSQALVSWTGTMFEYLMPNLVMPVFPDTLLDQTSRVVVAVQQAYGRRHGIPWGISESAYNRRDSGQTYQYHAFGLPSLGLKRGLDADLVVAPYATMLALAVDAPAAVANLRRLAATGLVGRYGFYDAIDYTAGRNDTDRPNPPAPFPTKEGGDSGSQRPHLPTPVPKGSARTTVSLPSLRRGGPGSARATVKLPSLRRGGVGGEVARRRSAISGAIVRTYMVHHAGMSLLALDNALHANRLPALFLAEPQVQAVDLLLQERIPRQTPLTQPPDAAATLERPDRQPLPADVPGDWVIRFETAATPQPLAHLLSNGEYTVVLTNSGAGYSQWRRPGTELSIAVTRWRDDATRDHWGSFCYLRDVREGLLWSAGYAPVGGPVTGYGGEWLPGSGAFWRRDGDIETHTQVLVSPDDAVELRQLTLTNRSMRPREIEVTSYAEVVLAPVAADLAHPAFQKLSIETAFVPEHEALLVTRRPRSPGEITPWLMHVLSVDGDARGGVEYETDRARFLGRGHDPQHPAALAAGAAPLSGTVGAVLDPIISLRRRVRLAPGEVARLTFATGIADTRAAALALADRYDDPTGGRRAMRLAATYARIQLAAHDLTPAAAMRAIRLAGRVLFPSPALRPSPDLLARNTLGQPGLWAYGISGDLPILLLRLSDPVQLPLVRAVVQAHNYWRDLGLRVDLVILNEYSEGYMQPVQDTVQAALAQSPATARRDQPGGIFLLRASDLPDAERILLSTVARVVLLGRRGSLSAQLQRADLPPAVAGRQLPVGSRQSAVGSESADPPTEPSTLNPQQTDLPPAVGGRQSSVGSASADPPTQHSTLNTQPFANGRGAFSADGREYRIHLDAGEWTPAPWGNVLANPEFGTLVSESAVGSTWSGNSRENRLTPWSNDPVSDPPSDILYLRDAAGGALWSPTPLPLRDDAPYSVRHGQGYTVYEHTAQDIRSVLTLFVPPDAPLRIARLTLHNPGPAARRISVTQYIEWVLGVTRDPAARFVITAWDATNQALLARNPYNNEFAGRLAFLAALTPVGGAGLSYTADRAAFLGRNNPLTRPAALNGATDRLDGQTGAGLDPCAAICIALELAPGATVEVTFALGEVAAAGEVAPLLAAWRAPGAVAAGLAATRRQWDDLLGTVQVQTPDPGLDLMLNRWLLYQTLVCRIWARSAFYQGGGAYGFRDQLQDVMALVHAAPAPARAQIVRAAGRQFPEGDVQHWWHPPTGRGVRTRFSDDLLWLPFVTAHYIETTGDWSVLDAQQPFLSAPLLQPGQEDSYLHPGTSDDSATVYEHCVRALQHGATQGAHGLPLMGGGDWNDGMNRVGIAGRGESVWVAWFLAATLDHWAAIATQRNDGEHAAWCRSEHDRLRGIMAAAAWDGAWFRRAYMDDGTPLGSQSNAECRIDSIAQSWAVLSGIGDPDQARQAMAALDAQLIQRDSGLVLLLTPPFDQTPLDPGYIKGYLPGVRENGGQYTHAAIWAGWAFAALRDGDRAHEVFALLNPIHHSADAAAVDRYKVEPYVIAADVYAHPQHLGRGGWTWYTGSAAWMYRLGLEAILGITRAGTALVIDPTIPPAWPGFRVVYRYGAATYTIQVDNAAGTGHGVAALTVDGTSQPPGPIPLDPAPGDHAVQVWLGAPRNT